MRASVCGPILLACLAALTPEPSRADAYTWTDETGTVHFSETPPAEAKSKKVGGAERSATSARVNGPESGKAEKIWVADTPSRTVLLEKVVPMLLDVGKGFTVGYACDGNAYSVADALRWGEQADLKTLFNLTLMAYGFTTPVEAAARSFANEGTKAPDLNLIAEIVDVSGGCGGVDKLRIRWRFWDNLRRKQVLELVTEGSDTDETMWSRPMKGRRAVSDGSMGKSLAGAFVVALEGLMRRPEFVSLVTPSVEPVDVAEVANERNRESLEPIVLPFRYGVGGGSFRLQVENLKDAAPTIRTKGGHGSGLLLAPGYVLTNNHVVASHEEVLVIMGKREISARVLRRDAERDVALLKLHEDVAVKPFLVGRRPPVDGDTLYVIGTPLDEGLSQSVTRGVLSGTREMSGLRYYQTDAAVNPGNSGGPVLDEHGELVGLVVSGLRTQSGNSLNVNYIIPIASALETLAIRPTLKGTTRAAP